MKFFRKKVLLITFLKYDILFFVLISLFTSCSFRSVEKNKSTRKLSKQKNEVTLKWDSDLSPQINQWFKTLYTTTRFNGNLLVAKDGKVIYMNSYGYANHSRNDTLTIKHRFQTGSVSKTFTAMAVMILKERGLLKYDDDVKKFIPEFPYNGVTIRQLLSHRSGLSNYNYFCDEYTDKETVIYNKDVLKLIIDSVPAPYYPPDYRFNYCNTNFMLLALIVEKVSGVPFEEFMREEIFKKAGMTATRIFINGEQNRIYKAATGYHYKWLEALPTYQDGVYGDKGVYTTIGDLWNWNLALEQNKLVTKETLEEAFKPASKKKKGNKNYGLGWRILTTIDSSKLIYHGGWWRGFNSLFVKDIKNNAVFIILSNVRTRAFYGMFPELLGIIDPERWQKQVMMDSLYIQQKSAGDSLKVKMIL